TGITHSAQASSGSGRSSFSSAATAVSSASAQTSLCQRRASGFAASGAGRLLGPPPSGGGRAGRFWDSGPLPKAPPGRALGQAGEEGGRKAGKGDQDAEQGHTCPVGIVGAAGADMGVLFQILLVLAASQRVKQAVAVDQPLDRAGSVDKRGPSRPRSCRSA